MYKHNIEARSHNRCCRGKLISITCSECVSVALGIQYVKRMHPIILPSVFCLAVPHFSTLSHARYDFLKKELLNIKRKCFDFLKKELLNIKKCFDFLKKSYLT